MLLSIPTYFAVRFVSTKNYQKEFLIKEILIKHNCYLFSR